MVARGPLVTYLTFGRYIQTLDLQDSVPIVIRIDGHSIKFDSFEWTDDGFKIGMRWKPKENPPSEVDLLAEKFVSQEPQPKCRMNFIDRPPANFAGWVHFCNVNPLAGTAEFGFAGSGDITFE
jgi:hypothetical protein